MKQGMTNSAACRTAGVNRKTGVRWRYGRTVETTTGQLRYAPIAEEEETSSKFLSSDERIRIADGHRAGKSSRVIGAEVGRHPTTVSREIARNSDPASGEYRPFAAQQQAASRRTRPKQRRVEANLELRAVVQKGLDKRWSPEQIAASLPAEHPDRVDMRACPETIYQAICAPGSVLQRPDRPVLRSGREHRRRRRRDGQRLERFTAPMTNVSERPDSADDRGEAGHWEGDLIVGAFNRSAIGTLVERSTRMTLLIHLAGGRSAERLRDEMVAVFAQLPAELRRSLTWDQGIEMARHHEFSAASGVPVYFCNRASPWQRPTNENTNGLLREYFPKGTDLSVHTLEDLGAVAAELNARPRKTLGWATPADLFASLAKRAALQ